MKAFLTEGFIKNNNKVIHFLKIKTNGNFVSSFDNSKLYTKAFLFD